MAIVLICEEDVLRSTCGCAPQSERREEKKSLIMMSRKVSGMCIVQMI